MKKINLSFWFGCIIIVILLLVVLFPALFTQSNPFGIEGVRSWSDTNGQFHVEKPPFEPREGLFMGSDDIGRDIYALIIYGSRLTLLLSLLIVLARFAIALPLGLSAGFGSVVAKSIINQFAVIFSAIPALLISILILNMDFFVQLEKGASLMAFTLVLTAVGWGKLGLIISERVEMILKEPYVAGDYAIGKNKVQITLTTVIPHLLPELIVLFFLEVARALSLLMQLGVFSVFVGNVRIIQDTIQNESVYMKISYEPEWASMLGTARESIRSAPWTLWYPASAFFISVLGLNLFGEGLRTYLQEKSNSISNIKGLWKNKRRVRMSVGAFILVLVMIITGVNFQRNLTFKAESMYPTDLSLLEGPVVIGTKNAEITAQYIGDQLEAMGFLPLKTETYLQPYSSKTAYYPHKSSLLINEGSNEMALGVGTDYLMFSFGNYNISSDIVDFRHEDLFNMEDSIANHPVEDKMVLLDSSYYTTEAIHYFSQQLIDNNQAAGVMWSTGLEALRQQQMGDLSYDGPALFIDKKWVDGLNVTESKIHIHMESKESSGNGLNVIAYRPGNDPEVKDEALIYGFAYNALDQEQTKSKIAFALEMIKGLLRGPENEGRTIIIAFFDGTLHEEFLGQKSYVTEIPYEQKRQILFVDMTRVEGVNEGQMLYSDEQSPITRYFAYSFARLMEDRLDREKIETIGLDPIWQSDMLLFLEQGTPTLVFGLKASDGDSQITRDKLGKVILETITFNNY